MHVPDEAHEPQRLWVCCLTLEAGEEIPGRVVGGPEHGFADMDERPQVVDSHVGAQERLLLGAAIARVVFLGEPRGKQRVDVFSGGLCCRELLERVRVWPGRRVVAGVDCDEHQAADAQDVLLGRLPLIRNPGSGHCAKGRRWGGLHRPILRTEFYGPPAVLRPVRNPRASQQNPQNGRFASKVGFSSELESTRV